MWTQIILLLPFWFRCIWFELNKYILKIIINFSYLIVLASTATPVLSGNDKCGYPCLVPNLREKLLLFTIEYDVTCELFICWPLYLKLSVISYLWTSRIKFLNSVTHTGFNSKTFLVFHFGTFLSKCWYKNPLNFFFKNFFFKYDF